MGKRKFYTDVSQPHCGSAAPGPLPSVGQEWQGNFPREVRPSGDSQSPFTGVDRSSAASSPHSVLGIIDTQASLLHILFHHPIPKSSWI